MAAELNDGPVETGAEMDYVEHDKTFDFFYRFTKWTTIAVVVLLILMAYFLL